MNEKWDGRFLAMAREIASWSKDPSSKIGAIAVDDNRRILAAGFNGFNRHDPDDIRDYYNRDVKYSKIIHAEKNLILNALNSGTSLKGATIYVHGLPMCKLCANEIVQTGVKEVICEWDQNGLKIQKWNDEWFDHSIHCLNNAKVSYKSYDREDTSPDRIVAITQKDDTLILQSRDGFNYQIMSNISSSKLEDVLKFYDEELAK
jgi:dCMP deaminase